MLQARFGVSTEACQCDHQWAWEGRRTTPLAVWAVLGSAQSQGVQPLPAPSCRKAGAHLPHCTLAQLITAKEFHFLSLVSHQGPVQTAKSSNYSSNQKLLWFLFIQNNDELEMLPFKKVLPDCESWTALKMGSMQSCLSSEGQEELHDMFVQLWENNQHQNQSPSIALHRLA